ncbi:MAG: Tn3 family transposase [Chloroflexi bacterium]|nr:Tn3 family transposase [Chloroflexota bacterium]
MASASLWELIETYWQDLLQVVLSVRAGVLSSALLSRKLGTYRRRNHLYQASRRRVAYTAGVIAYPTLPLPRFFRVHQALPTDRVPDVPAAVREALDAAGLAERLPPGASVAITAGSRGIASIPIVVRSVVDYVRALGCEPFVVPAMGSHGGATPEGQRHVLAEYGITEQSVGAPIRATMDTVQLGQLPSGAGVHFDANAAGADATVVVNRVKAHTAFRGEIESGLCKMTAIGLGKQAGAEQAHAHGLRETIPAAAALSLERANVVAGVALVENAAHELAIVRGVRPQDFLSADRELLRAANEFLPRVPFDHLHLLVVGWLGKNLSGSGMDYNVVGMWRRIGGEPVPNFERIAVLDITEESDGNGLGVGIADFTTERLLGKLDRQKMYMNGLTANALAAIKIPPALESDRQAMEVALHSVGHSADARIAVVRNTLELDELWVSEALSEEVSRSPRLSVAGPVEDLAFSADGRLEIVSSPRPMAHVASM